MATSDGEPTFNDVSLSIMTTGKPAATSLPETADSPEKPVGDADEQSAPYVLHKHFEHKKTHFYSSSEGALEKAVEDIKSCVYNRVADGDEILGSWLLVEVDHWDNETEKVVVLTTESLLTVRYDFVPRRVYKFKRQALKDFDTVKAGEFLYPKYSLINISDECTKRTCSGVRLMWNKGMEPSLLAKWNPSSSSMSWQTFTYHPLAFTEEGKAQTCFSVMNFTETVVKAINEAYRRHNPNTSLVVVKAPLEQNVYFGFPSQIHNQSFLGMSKDRGLVSF